MFARSTASLLLLGALAAVVGACAASTLDPGDESRESVAESRHALVTVDALSSRTTGEMDSLFETRAHFASYRGMALRTVASALDVWRPVDEPGCVILEPPTSADSGASLDLLSAGTVGISGNGDSVTFQPRFIGAGPRLSGFTYAADASSAGPIWAAGEPYTLWAAGDEIGNFAVTLQAPERIQLVSVGDHDLGSATETRLAPGEDLDLTLFSEADTVYVSLRPLQAFGGTSAECRFGAVDSIRFDVAELDDAFGVGTDLEVTVRTATSEPLPAGVGSAGEVIATVYDRVVVRR